MGFNLRRFGKIQEQLMYNDNCTISRLKKTTNAYGASTPNGREVIFENIKCKFSFKNIDTPDDKSESNIRLVKQVGIFVSLDYDIKSGDLITGRRIDIESGISQTISGICGDPNRFDTHQEIPIEIDGTN